MSDDTIRKAEDRARSNAAVNERARKARIRSAVMGTILHNGDIRVMKDDDSPEANAYWEYAGNPYNPKDAFSKEMLLQGYDLSLVKEFRADACGYVVCHVDDPLGAALCNCMMEDLLAGSTTLATAMASSFGGKLPRLATAESEVASAERAALSISVRRELEMTGMLKDAQLNKGNWHLRVRRLTRADHRAPSVTPLNARRMVQVDDGAERAPPAPAVTVPVRARTAAWPLLCLSLYDRLTS